MTVGCGCQLCYNRMNLRDERFKWESYFYNMYREAKTKKNQMKLIDKIIEEADETAAQRASEFTGFSTEQMLSASIKLARLYYEIAVRAMGENEVRKQREEILNENRN